MNEYDLAGVKTWIARQIADLCEMLNDDGTIIEIGTMASDILKERRKRNEG